MKNLNSNLSKNPSIMLTTSKKPSKELKKFIIQLEHLFSKSVIIPRNNMFIFQVINKSLTSNFSDLIICYEKRGNPNIMVICHLPSGPSVFFGISLKNMKFNGRNKMQFKIDPLIIFSNLDSELGKKLKEILKKLFSIPKKTTTRLISFTGCGKVILVSNFMIIYQRPSDIKFSLKEIGPSFSLFPLKISLGLVDSKDDKIEWRINIFLRNYSRRSFF